MDFRYVIKGASAPEKVILFPLSDEREEEELLENVYERVCEMFQEAAEGCNADKHGGAFDFAIVGVFVPDWDRYLSPWRFEDERRHFSGEGETLLAFILDTLLPELKERFQPASSASSRRASSAPSFLIGGYSLSGLFCLWAALKTRAFSGCASCSGSVWYPGFYEWALKKAGETAHESCRSASEAPEAFRLYLSLGTREEKTRDPYMREVGNCTRGLYEHFSSDPARFSTVLEWNPGNHFRDVPERIAKGFFRLLKKT